MQKNEDEEKIIICLDMTSPKPRFSGALGGLDEAELKGGDVALDKLIEGPEEIRRSFIETIGLIGAWASERPDLEKERGFFMFAAQFMGNLYEFTHSELADALNISPATWSRMIKGMKIVADDLEGGAGRELQKSTQRALLSGLIGLVEHALERLLAPDRVENGGEDEVASGQLSAQDVAGITSCE